MNHLVFMSPDRDTRISLFRDEANRVNLPPEAASKWEVLLEARPPKDDELGDIQDDLNDTPIAVRNTIQEQLARGTASIDTLVPRSVRYYERLVGRYEEGLSFDNYVARVAMPAMDASNDGRTNLTHVTVNTPAHVEGRIWILVNSAGLFSAHCTAAAAAQAQAISGGKVREFKLNSANKAAGGDLQKAQIAAIKAAHAAPQSLSLLKNRS